MQGVHLVFLNKSSKSFAGASSSFFFCFRTAEDKKNHSKFITAIYSDISIKSLQYR